MNDKRSPKSAAQSNFVIDSNGSLVIDYKLWYKVTDYISSHLLF